MAPLWKLLLATTYLVVAVEGLVVPNEATDSLVADEQTRRSSSPADSAAILAQIESREDAANKKGHSQSDQSNDHSKSTSSGSGQEKPDKQKDPKKDKGKDKKKTAKGTSTGGNKPGSKGKDDTKVTTGIWKPNVDTYFQDPCLIKDPGSGYWYAFSTQTCFYKMPVVKSKSLQKGANWTMVEKNPIHDHSFGGPDVIQRGKNRFVVAYGDGKDTVAQTSDSLEGPWANKTILLTPTPGGTTALEHNVGDASYFEDGAKLYMVYTRKIFDKQEKRHLSSQLEIQELDPSGTSTKKGGYFKKLQKARPAKKGQKNPDLNIEAPNLVYRKGWYYLTFSTREYVTPAYNTQYVSSKTLDGLADPSAKWHPLLNSKRHADGTQLNGPGSLSFGRGGTGNEIAFHDRGPGKSKCKSAKGTHRELWVGDVKFDNGLISIA